MSMLTHCKMCHHEYGAWRPQCTACGTPTPRVEPLNTPRVAERRVREEPVTRERRCATICAFCKCRGAKDKCDDCGELIHPFCRHLHKEAAHRQHELRVT